MAEPRAAYHHGDVPNALVATATDLMRASGAENFGLREVSKILGVSANATYRHFENKSALLAEVAKVAGEKLGQKMRRKVADVERQHAGLGEAAITIEVLKATGRSYFAFAVEEPQLYRVVYAHHGICTTTQGRPSDPATYSLSQRIFEDTLDRLVASGATPENRVDASVRVWTVLHGFASLVIDGAAHFVSIARRAEALEELLDFTIRGLGVSLEAAKTRSKPKK